MLEAQNKEEKRNIFVDNDYLFDEVIALQVRRALELVAFASLAANKDAYQKVHRKFSDHHSAKGILKELNIIHPSFYPRPFRIVKKNEDLVQAQEIDSGYLTQEEFEYLYIACCSIVHVWNPFKEQEKVVYLKHPIPDWIQKIENLVRWHTVNLLGYQTIWIIDFGDYDSDLVHAFTAEPDVEV